MLTNSSPQSNSQATMMAMASMMMELMQRRAASNPQGQIFANAFLPARPASTSQAQAAQVVATLMEMATLLSQSASSNNEKGEPQVSKSDLEVFKSNLEKSLSPVSLKDGGRSASPFGTEEAAQKLLKITDTLLENFTAIARLSGDAQYIDRDDLVQAAELSGDPLSFDTHNLSLLQKGNDASLPTTQMPWWIAANMAQEKAAANARKPVSNDAMASASSTSACNGSPNAFRLPNPSDPWNRHPEEVKPYTMGGDQKDQQQDQDQQQQPKKSEETKSEEAPIAA